MLFFGPPGRGKTTLARLIAAADRRPARAALGGQLRRPPTCAPPSRARARRAPSARRARSSSSTRSTASTRRSRTRSCRAIEDGDRHADRRHHREPLLRGQLGAASPLPALPFEPLAPETRGARRRRPRSRTRSAASAARRVTLGDGALDFLAGMSRGDARVALNALETAVALARPPAPGAPVTLDGGRPAGRGAEVAGHVRHGGDAHYDTISAFIKSMRGSDPDAAVYCLARDGRRRRGPQVHRPAHDRLRQGGRGQRRPAGAAGRRRRRARGRVRRAARVPHQPEPGGRRTWRWRRRATPPTRRSTPRSTTCEREGNQPPPLHLRSANYCGAKELGHGARVPVPAHRRRLGPAAVSAGQALGRRYYVPIRGVESELAARLDEIRRRAARAAKGKRGRGYMSGVYVWVLLFLVVALAALVVVWYSGAPGQARPRQLADARSPAPRAPWSWRPATLPACTSSARSPSCSSRARRASACRSSTGRCFRSWRSWAKRSAPRSPRLRAA